MFDLKTNRRLLFLALVFALLFAPSTLRANRHRNSQGTVSDSKGAVVPGADVVVRNRGDGPGAQSENRMATAFTSHRFCRWAVTR